LVTLVEVGSGAGREECAGEDDRTLVVEEVHVAEEARQVPGAREELIRIMPTVGFANCSSPATSPRASRMPSRAT
jgi:hypothetical protein